MSKICFFENTDVVFCIVINETYLISRLKDLELLIKAKHTNTVWSLKLSDQKLSNENSNSHVFHGQIKNSETIGKHGAYEAQVRIIDEHFGEQKFEIHEVSILRAIAIKSSEQNNIGKKIFFEIKIDDLPISIDPLIVGNDVGGTIEINTIDERLSGILAEYVFENTKSNPSIIITDADDNYAMGHTNIVFVTNDNNSFQIRTKSGISLEKNKKYKWNYLVND